MILTNKLMIVGCLLSFVIGASALLPFLISSPEFGRFRGSGELGPNPQSEVSQIGASFEYAYIKHETRLISKGANTTEQVERPYINGEILLNATKYLNSKDSTPDAEIDYFLIEVLSEDGTIIETTIKQVGTSYNSSFTYDQTKARSFSRDIYSDLRTGGGGAFYSPWPIGTYVIERSAFGGTIDLDEYESMERSQTLTMSLSRIGSVSFRGDSAEFSNADAGLIEQVQLTKYGGGFVYDSAGLGSRQVPVEPIEPSS